MSSRSRSKPLDLLAPAPLPGTWGLVVGMAGIHLTTAWISWVRDWSPFWYAFILDRSPLLREGLGGQTARMVARGEHWRLLTSVFLHGDLLHMLVNAGSIWVLGRLLEPLLGTWRWLGWFVLGGLGASLASHLSGVRASDGASGGAFALLGAALILGLRLRPHLSPEDSHLLGKPLWGFTAINLFLSFVLPWIDAIGHVAGLAIGLLLGALAYSPESPAPRWLNAAWGAGLIGVFGLALIQSRW